ncbi:hypothetical protein BVRB_7g165720 [Beta vulgaris subsp. vulgaris]|nr:hypothetical protein BVRB_7g165720 [Beta vulgaris subsp. vulgaris]
MGFDRGAASDDNSTSDECNDIRTFGGYQKGWRSE